jgi:hypothetical protein
MAPFSTKLAARSLLSGGGSSGSGFPTIAIVGFIVAGVIALLVVLWIIIRFYRKRAQRKRENARGAAFLSVKGLVNEGESYEPKEDVFGYAHFSSHFCSL